MNDIYGQVMNLEREERNILYDVVQAITVAHDLYIDDKNIKKKSVENKLSKEGFQEDSFFPYWFYTILFSVFVWRIGFDAAVRIVYGSLAGVISEYKNDETDNWADFSISVAKNREMAELITDFIFGFRGVGGESDEQVQSGESN